MTSNHPSQSPTFRSQLRRLPVRFSALAVALRDRLLGDIALVTRRLHDADYPRYPISHRHARLPATAAVRT